MTERANDMADLGEAGGLGPVTCYAKVGNRRQPEWACARDTTTALRPGHSSRATGA